MNMKYDVNVNNYVQNSTFFDFVIELIQLYFL